MAIDATAVWEARTSGASTNGGFFVPGSGGTDYSQQDSAQLSLSDIATDGAGTGLSSTTGGFTSAMVGNGIYLTGGGATAGYYEVTAYTDTNNITIDRSAGASKTGVTGNVGGALYPQHDSDFEGMEAGNTMWMEAGTYTLTSNITLNTSGTEALRISIRGYNSTRGDDPTGTDRPYISGGAYYIILSNYVDFHNIRMDGTGTIVLRAAFNNYVRNCKFQNTSGTADRRAADTISHGPTFLDCEMISDNGYGCYWSRSNGVRLIHSYVHDCGTAGIYVISDAGYSEILFSIIDTCVIGILLHSTLRGLTVMNTVIYNNSSYGVQAAATADNIVFLNCDFNSNGTAIGWDTDGHEGENWEDYCNFYNNSTKFSNFGGTGIQGTNSIAVDSKYTNAASGDFSLQNDSGLRGTASQITLGVG